MLAGRLISILKKLVLSRLGSSAIGLVAVVALIWFAGPRLGLTGSTRYMAIAAVSAIFVLVYLFRWWLARRRGNQLQKELGGGDADSDVDALHEKMSQAIASLKSSQLGAGYRGSAALYALPWYMVIGPSAAGKSTLLRNSGLHFPYADADDLHFRGVGGTRNCDWWFSDQAVLLDTAGRYTTEEDDREEWLSFLDMLRKQRKQTPVNGVLVAISVADLLTADTEGLERHIKIIRERINELMTRLGLTFPVFIVFTKTDLIPGFEAFFEDLSDSEREQVWGAYLLEDNGEKNPAEQFEDHTRDLYQKLCELRLRKLSMQRNLDRKAALYAFPDQFQAAAEKLSEFINLLFRDNPYQEMPRFAGAYFTSGTQEGTPLTRLLGNLRQAFGFDNREQPARSTPPKPFFIHRFFTEVVIPLQGAAHGNRRRLIWHRTLKAVSIGAAVCAIGGTLLLLAASYGTNKMLLNEGVTLSKKMVVALEDDRYDTLDRFQVMESLYRHYLELKQYEEHKPWRFRFGIYTGDKQIPEIEHLLASSMDVMYRDVAIRSLELTLENHARSWEAADRQGQEAIREDYYGALKSYLMLSRAPQRMSADTAVPVLNRLWLDRKGLQGEAVFREAATDSDHALYGVAHFYLSRRAASEVRWNARQELIDQARNHLRTPPNAQQMYAQIVSKGATALSPYRVEDMLDRNSQKILGAGKTIPGIYTREGWEDFVLPQIDARIESATRGDWVLTGQYDLRDGENADGELIDEVLAAELRGQIRDLYFGDYAKAWRDFIASVRIRRFDSLADGVKRLDRLSRSGGPIGQLMNVASRNLALFEAAPDLVAGAAEAVPEGQRQTIKALDERTTELRRFTAAAEERSVSELIHQYLLIVSALKTDMEKLALSVDVGREAEVYAGNILGRGGSETELYKGWVTISSLLGGADVETREALRPLFEGPVRESWRNVLLEARSGIASQWQQDVASIFDTRLRNRFPFDEKGRDATMDDMSDFFQPGSGRLWRFVDNSLSPFIEQTRNGWQEKTWLDQGLGLSSRFLASLSSAQVITESLFGRGGRRPEMSFYLYPVPARGVSEIVLETSGQSYRYRNGPQEWRRFSWPGDHNNPGAKVSGVSRRGQVRDEIKVSGPWALFRLLNEAVISRESSSEFVLQWELNGGLSDPLLVKYRLRADRQANVFNQRVLSRFNLPHTMLRPLTPSSGSVLEAG
ncbi:MAG: type VI secretion system membrane subunit TssM [Pseudomonadales bacterium]|nr:type VI secretion system membrane subunit TssM [Pseudomonadales bacterium]